MAVAKTTKKKPKVTVIHGGYLFPLEDYPKSTKEQVRKQLAQEGYRNISYSGKLKAFHANKN